MESKEERALDMFKKGYNCAQSVLYAFSEEVGLEKDQALRIATGMGGGMGRRGEVCGAVTGGILALGMKFGRGEREERQVTELMYVKTRELMERFVAEHRSYLCRSLLDGLDISSEEGYKKFKEQDYLNRICTPCVRSVVKIVEHMIQKTR